MFIVDSDYNFKYKENELFFRFKCLISYVEILKVPIQQRFYAQNICNKLQQIN